MTKGMSMNLDSLGSVFELLYTLAPVNFGLSSLLPHFTQLGNRGMSDTYCMCGTVMIKKLYIKCPSLEHSSVKHYYNSVGIKMFKGSVLTMRPNELVSW